MSVLNTMERFPKVLFFVLTFLFCSHSAHAQHSSLLTHLKRRYAMVESFFSDIFMRMGDVLGNWKPSYVDLDDRCIYSCPGEVVPVKNEFYTPTSNGCGPEEFSLRKNRFTSPRMTECCNAHDICYGTCNSDKDKCDLNFKECLHESCENEDPDEIQKCEKIGKLMYSSASTLGCKYYQNSQSMACYCPPSHEWYSSEEL